MPSTTWHTDLTTTTDPATLGAIRLWLKQNREAIPTRDADAVAKYVRLAIHDSSLRAGVLVPFTMSRPRPVGQPRQMGFEGDAPRSGWRSPEPESLLQQLASVAFGLLMMLALYVAFAG